MANIRARAMAKVRGTNIEIHQMQDDSLLSFSPENSPGMRARLDAMTANQKHPDQEHSAIGKDGVEYLDPTPMAPPIGYKPEDPLRVKIREMIQSEALRFYADQEGHDTFEEADDFEVPDDDDEFDTANAPYEQHFDPLPPGELSRLRQAEYVKQRESELNPDPRRQKEPGSEEKPVGGGGGTPPPEAP